ncbi:zinc finger protein 462-like [Antennarius striatus]|uniref:zinc finger protein 462-like n=1 Tax=Antennarius striatus TaxID=241820 RepID=UPI0035ADB92B
MPTSTTKFTLNSSEDTESYNKPSQAIKKCIKETRGSNGMLPTKLFDSPEVLDGPTETLILEKTPSESSPTKGGVFKVTAKPVIDVSACENHNFLPDDHLRIPDLRHPNMNGKRSINESSTSPPTKKIKSETEDMELLEEANGTTHQRLSNTELSFECDENEDKKKVNLHGNVKCPDVYYCKHCDYSDGTISRLSAHYQNDHPYIKFRAVYIQDSNDQSATFRCLECPVEFLSTATLKKHYSENHPGAPNIFTMQSHEFYLVYKCFLCQFFTDTLTPLKEHYKENHPKHKMDNSLMYSRYSRMRPQDGHSQLINCENVPNAEKSQEINHKSVHTPCEEVKNASSLQPPTSKGEHCGIYHCNSCKFNHKSVIVMHVHYKRHHPEVAVTIDKIKQSASVAMETMSQMIPDKCPNFVPPKKRSSLRKTPPDSFKKTEKTQNEISLPQHSPDCSETHSESPRVSENESCANRRKRQKSHHKSVDEISTEMENSPNCLFYCQFCNFSSSKIKGVLGHHNAKHSAQVSTSVEAIISYSANVQKKSQKKFKKKSDVSARTTSFDSKISKQLDIQTEKEVEHEGNDANPYNFPEKLFYCQKCNYGNTSAQGVLNHQTKVHPSIDIKLESVVEYTYVIRDEITKSKIYAKHVSFSAHLPLPLISKGEKDVFFCHFCNYRHREIHTVLRHYAARHDGFVTDAEHIRKHTAMILSKIKKSHLKKKGSQKHTTTSLGKKELKTKTLGTLSAKASRTRRPLCCPKCPYNTQYACLLKRHMREAHKSKRLVATVLTLSQKQGTLMVGFHCELCAFYHKKAAVVFKHYQEQHPDCKRSLNYVTTQLYVRPKALPSKKKKTQKKHTEGVSEDTGDSLPSQSSGQSETKTYMCRACSFKGSSISSITYHYRSVHPWSVKEDGSVLYLISSKKRSASRHAQVEKELPASFDTYQAPIEFEKSPDSSCQSISSKKFKCAKCSAVFPTLHGVSVHCGIKHQGASLEDLDEQQQEGLQIQTKVHVYNCPHCTYVNSSNQGVVRHCQMKHQSLVEMVDSLYVDEINLQGLEDCVKMKSTGLRIRGYMCKTCPQICTTPEKLTMHCKEGHNGTVARTLPQKPKPVPEPSAVSRKKLKTHNKISLSKSSSLSKTNLVSCQCCSYKCTTKFELAQHYQFHHSNEFLSKAEEFSYKCTLCPKFYFKKNRLGMHYAKKHGREAFLKYYASSCKLAKKKTAAAVPKKAVFHQAEISSNVCESNCTTREDKKMFYKCPSCCYVNVSYHGTLTHFQMKHPKIVVRADELQTVDIQLSNMSGYTVGTGSNLGGYACEICLQIHASSKKLKIHCYRDHQQAEGMASKCSAEAEVKPAYGYQDSELEAVSIKTKMPTVSTTSAETCQASIPPGQDDKVLFKCTMCNYEGSCRKYLHTHYKNAHKLDSLSASKLLEKYNKFKNKRIINQPVEMVRVKCKLCPDLKFDSYQKLIDHYNTFHCSDFKLDFIVLSQPSKKTTGLYKCSLCENKKLYGIRKLHYHLNCHREKERRRATVAKNRALVVIGKTEHKTIKICGQEELPSLETVEEQAKSKETSETLSVPQSHRSSPSKPTDLEQSCLESKKDKFLCKHCGKTLKSLAGLRSHESSHAAMATIKNQNNRSTSGLKQKIKKYVRFRDGTLRPFRCNLCLYKTTVMALWINHFMKNHQSE